MIPAFCLLLCYQLVGEITVRALALPLPGPVLGMLLLFVTLLIRRTAPDSLERVSNGLLTHLALLFVPAGVGIIRYLDVVQQQGWALALTLSLSTLLTLAFCGYTMHLLLRRREA